MKISELADIVGIDLVIVRKPLGKYTAEFRDAEMKRDRLYPLLGGEYGTGASPEEAISDYVQKIKGKWCVVNAYSTLRREFGIPNTLEA